MNWAIGIDMYTQMCIKWMTNKNLLYKKINEIKLKNFKKNNNVAKYRWFLKLGCQLHSLLLCMFGNVHNKKFFLKALKTKK